MTVLEIHMLMYVQWVFEMSNVMHDIIQRVILYIVYWAEWLGGLIIRLIFHVEAHFM